MRTALLSAIAAVALGLAALPSSDAFAQRGHGGGGPGIHRGGPAMGGHMGGGGPRMGRGGGPRMGGHIGSGPRFGHGPRVGNRYAYRGHRGWHGGRRYIGPGIGLGFVAPYAYASCYQVRRVPTRWGLQYRRVRVC
jgi:hypothetical protein